MRAILAAWLAALALLIVETPVAASEVAEVDDAGQTLETAQIIPVPPDIITGSLNTNTDVDIFQISIPIGAMFTATTVFQDQTLVDSQLFLFDANGLVIVANDDDPSAVVGLRSTIRAGPLTGEIYFLAISPYPVVPTDDMTANSWFGEGFDSEVSYRIAIATETTPPSLTLTRISTDALGKNVIEVTAQDSGSGLAAIDVLTAVNITVSIPSFDVGTVSPVVVTATEIDPSMTSSLLLQVTDSARCITTKSFFIPDTFKPSCAITRVATDPEGKKFIEIAAQDTGTGLASINVRFAQNTEVDIPSFAAATIGPVVVRATKIAPSMASRVELEVTDVVGNVTVYTPLVLSCSSVIATAGPSQCLAVVNFGPGATELLFGTGSVVCEPSSGATFPVGITTVTCSAQDVAGNPSDCSCIVTVADITAPTITCGPDQIVECACPEGTLVDYGVDATDNCDPNVSYNCTPPSGTLFPVGSTEVICTATDGSGTLSSCSFTVTLVDTTSSAQPLLITDIIIQPDGRVRIRYSATPNSQYTLYRGEDVTDIHEVTQSGLATSNIGEFIELFRPNGITFYRVAEVP